MPRHVRNQVTSLLLADVVRAARFAAKVDVTARRRGEADALRCLGHLARVAAPARGVLAPVEDDLCREIHRIAQLHLGYGRASRRFRKALKRAGTYKNRDAIETAHAEVINVSSTAYYYAGLAFGLAFQRLSGK